jgi:hypothetical protein
MIIFIELVNRDIYLLYRINIYFSIDKRIKVDCIFALLFSGGGKGGREGGTDPSDFDESFLRFQEKIRLGFIPILGADNIKVFSNFRRR